MVTIETYDDKGNLVKSETRPDPPPHPDRVAVRDAIAAINPDNATTLLLARTELVNLKAALAKLARFVASIEAP